MYTTGYTDLTDPGSQQRLYIVCHTSIHEEQLFRYFKVLDVYIVRYTLYIVQAHTTSVYIYTLCVYIYIIHCVYLRSSTDPSSTDALRVTD